MVVVAGFMYIVGYAQGGDAGMISTAHNLLKNIGWGLLIIYGAHVFISFIMYGIGWQWGPWWVF